MTPIIQQFFAWYLLHTTLVAYIIPAIFTIIFSMVLASSQSDEDLFTGWLIVFFAVLLWTIFCGYGPERGSSIPAWIGLLLLKAFVFFVISVFMTAFTAMYVSRHSPHGLRAR